jgi:hypothetical protein
MRIRRVLASLAVVAPLLVIGLVPQATAATGEPQWGPPVRAAEDVQPARSVSTGDGTISTVASETGGATLNAPMVLLRRAPSGRWSRTRLPYAGSPAAVADDGRTTFLLFTVATPGQMELRIATVSHAGASSPSRLLDRGDHLGPSSSLIARDGRWWAAWVMANGRVPRPAAPIDFIYTLREARTVLPAYGTRPLLRGAATDNTGLVPAAGLSPKLVWRGPSQVLLTLDRPGYTEFWAANLPQGFHRTRYRVASHNPTQPGGSSTSVITVGRRTFLAYVRGGRQVLAHDNADLRFTERVLFPTSAGSSSLLAASGERIFLGHNRCFTYSGGFTCRGYVAAGGLTGALRNMTDLTAPFAVRIPDTRSGLFGLTAIGGRATALLSDGSGATYTRDQR